MPTNPPEHVAVRRAHRPWRLLGVALFAAAAACQLWLHSHLAANGYHPGMVHFLAVAISFAAVALGVALVVLGRDVRGAPGD